MNRIVISALSGAQLLLGACVSSASDDAVTKAADAFYAAAQPMVEGVPAAENRAKLQPFITARLEKQLAGADAAEAKHTTDTNNQEPPFIEGNLFSSTFEGYTSYAIGACTGDAMKQTCDVALVYKDPSGESKWTDHVILVNENGAWKVDDIGYGADWEFGNKGMISQTLDWTIKGGVE